MARIGIIGCGWLGRPLAISLTKEHEVVCYSRKPQTDPDLEYSFKPESGDPFWKKELFIMSISTKDDYLETLGTLIKNIPPEAILILMSSTSVYKEFDTEVDEDSPITQSTLQKQAEESVLALKKEVLVLRLGGLMGNDRIAGRWKSVTAFSDGPVNYIHQDDVIAIVHRLIEKRIKKGIFNLVAPLHPLRSGVHLSNSRTFGFTPGRFEGMSNRIVQGGKLKKLLKYDFIHPDPMLFWT